MRELEFRVWEEREKEYDTWSYILDDSGNLFRNAYGALIECDKKDYIIEQYTGLKDKNGQKIYEGDIVTFLVECFNNVTLGFESEDWHTAVVEWNQDDACYSFMVRDVPFSVRYEAEVIGNIHKQPELLEANDVD